MGGVQGKLAVQSYLERRQRGWRQGDLAGWLLPLLPVRVPAAIVAASRVAPKGYLPQAQQMAASIEQGSIRAERCFGFESKTERLPSPSDSHSSEQH